MNVPLSGSTGSHMENAEEMSILRGQHAHTQLKDY
jgi:hypothetical protein